MRNPVTVIAFDVSVMKTNNLGREIQMATYVSIVMPIHLVAPCSE